MVENEILISLRKKEYDLVYFLQGEESFYIDEISKYIEENAISECNRAFNQTILYGKDSSMAQILDSARRFPMMGEKQVVIIREAQNLQEFKNEAARNMLIEYCNNPMPSTILVFCHKYTSLNNNTNLAKVLKKKTVFLTTKAIKDYQLPAWIKSYLGTNGLKATEQAVQLLANHIGTNLERLASEINKLFINIEKKVVIDIHHINKYVGIHKEYNVFELQKAICNKDVVKSNTIIKYFGNNPKENHPIPIIALLYNFFTRVLKMYTATDKSKKGLISHLKVSPYAINDYNTAARNYSLNKVLQNIIFLHKADLVAKGIESPQIKEGIILKQLVFELLH